MRRYRMDRLPAVALAIAMPAAAAIVMVALDVPIRRDVVLLVAVALVLFVAWLGGIWPALLTTLLLDVLLASRVGPLVEFAPELDAWSLFLFAVASLLGIGVIESLYRTQWRVESARDRARSARRDEHAVRAELESIVEAIGDGIVVAEDDGVISLMNRTAVDMFGRRPATFQELLREFTPDDDTADPAERLNGDGPITAEFRLGDPTRRIELSSFPMVSEGEGRRVVRLRDVTAARQRELVRDAFLSVLSHELRTPMTAVYGGASLLQRVGDQLDAETRNELRADIVTEAERLARLMDDLLVLTRLEEGIDVGQEPALLQHLVASVVQTDKRTIVGRTIDVVADPGLPPVKGDETSIRQVTHNLLSNAVKYSPSGSTIEIRVEPGVDQVLVRVLDRGRGVPDVEAGRVFEPFYRAKDVDRMASGVGIGLYVSRRLVEGMGGHIWTRQRQGGGTEFGFALPLWPIEPDEAVTEPVASGAVAGDA